MMNKLGANEYELWVYHGEFGTARALRIDTCEIDFARLQLLSSIPRLGYSCIYLQEPKYQSSDIARRFERPVSTMYDVTQSRVTSQNRTASREVLQGFGKQ